MMKKKIHGAAVRGWVRIQLLLERGSQDTSFPWATSDRGHTA